MPDPDSIYLSTRVIPKASRFDFYMDVLQNSLWQVSDWDSLPEDFNVEMRGASLGCLMAVTQSISTHHSHRTRTDVDHSAERNCHLFVSTRQSWAFTHLGRHERLDAGDVVLIGEGEHETHAPEGFEGVIVKCPEQWVRTWIPEHQAVSGRCIRGDTTWGKVLSLTLQQLSPEFCAAPPVHASAVADQVGSLLALVANDATQRANPGLLARARDCIRQRCAEPGLAAADVAATLDVPATVLHHALTTARTSFASELVRARTECAWQLLHGQGATALTLDELARRTGFTATAHLARALRRRPASAGTGAGAGRRRTS